MNHFIALLLLLSFDPDVYPPISEPQPLTDHEAIMIVVNYYYEGVHMRDLNALGRAYHPEAVFTFVDAGQDQVEQFPIGEYLHTLYDAEKHFEQRDRKLKIHEVDVSGNVAMVKSCITYSARGYRIFDYLTLTKDEGEWRIIRRASYKQMASFETEDYLGVRSKRKEKAYIRSKLRSYLHDHESANWVGFLAAFHPAAKVTQVDPRGQKCFTWNLDQYQSELNHSEMLEKFPRKGVIDLIDMEGNIAIAKVHLYYPKLKTFTVDFLTLVKTNGQWQIIQKATHKEPRALAMPG